MSTPHFETKRSQASYRIRPWSSTISSYLVIHPTAICESQSIGEGTRIWAFAHILDGAIMGRECNIGDSVFVESGARIGDRVTLKNRALICEGVTIENDVFIGPGVIFTNDRYPRSRGVTEANERYQTKKKGLTRTRVERGATIGAGAVILSGVTIGSFASVGAGAVVTQDVLPGRVVIGNPARDVGAVCKCGMPLRGEAICGSCGSRDTTSQSSPEQRITQYV